MNNYYKYYFQFLGLAAAAALAVAYIAELVFGMMPCKMCYYQRWVFVAILFTCMLSIHPRFPRMAGVKFVALLLFVSICVSITHLAVENDWIKLDLSCTGNIKGKVESVEEFKAMIMSKDDIPCDVIRGSFLGLTFAGWNFIYSSLLFMISLALIYVFMGTPSYEKKIQEDRRDNKS